MGWRGWRLCQSLKQMQKWAETLQTEGRFGETEQLICKFLSENI